MTVTIATGGNYAISLSDGIVHARVWRTPDVDSKTGAAYAQEKLAHLVRLATNADVRALLLDLSEAPYVAGPKTQTALGTMIGCFESVGKPIIVVVGISPVQSMQLQRIVGDVAPKHGQLVGTKAEALRRLQAALP